MTTKEREKAIYRVTIAGSIINMVLLAFKFIAGILVRFPYRHRRDGLCAHQF